MLEPLVNNPDADGLADVPAVTSLVLGSGSNVIAAFGDTGSAVGDSNGLTGFSRSTDGGFSWTDGGALPGNNDGGSDRLRMDVSRQEPLAATY